MKTKGILVGTDGAAAGQAAVRWAAREAQRRGMRLRIVHAFDWQWQAARYDSGTEYIDVAQQLADAVTSAARDQATAVAPGVSLELDTLIGTPAPILLAAAEDADLLVVGNRGRGGFGVQHQLPRARDTVPDFEHQPAHVHVRHHRRRHRNPRRSRDSACNLTPVEGETPTDHDRASLLEHVQVSC